MGGGDFGEAAARAGAAPRVTSALAAPLLPFRLPGSRPRGLALGSCSSRGRTNFHPHPPTPVGAEPPTPLHGLGAPWLPPLGLGRVRATLLLPGVCCCEIWGGFFGGAELPRSCSGVPRGPRRLHRLSLFPQQLYQTLSDFDIRFYMYEILKVSPQEPPPELKATTNTPRGALLGPKSRRRHRALGQPPAATCVPPGVPRAPCACPIHHRHRDRVWRPPPGAPSLASPCCSLGVCPSWCPPCPEPPR